MNEGVPEILKRALSAGLCNRDAGFGGGWRVEQARGPAAGDV